jgi:hypothetical protein
MIKKDKAIDGYIAKSADFAKPILLHWYIKPARKWKKK